MIKQWKYSTVKQNLKATVFGDWKNGFIIKLYIGLSVNSGEGNLFQFYTDGK